MAYFSNGTEGMAYEGKWCAKCHHNKRPTEEDPYPEMCAVWLAHQVHNYRFCNDDESPLDLLIPRLKEGLGNDQCKMFLPRQGKLPGEADE